MKIGELARETGLTASSIRFYEASGLIVSARQGNGYREYDAHTVEVLRVVRFGQQLGFSLDEIKRMIPMNAAAGWPSSDALLPGLRRKLTEVDQLRQKLDQTRTQLVELIHRLETQPGGLTCEDMSTIRELSSS